MSWRGKEGDFRYIVLKLAVRLVQVGTKHASLLHFLALEKQVAYFSHFSKFLENCFHFSF